MITLTTAGESHGKGLFAILEGIPSGLTLDLDAIDAALARRQSGYGRGARQKIERDHVEILSGVRDRVTLGTPIALCVKNRDYANWQACIAPEGCDAAAMEQKKLTKVRPGHADLAGSLKFGHTDARNVLERASARETAVRVAAGEICRQLLDALHVEVGGFVRSVGSVSDGADYAFSDIAKRSPVLGFLDPALEARAVSLIEETAQEGDTLGGVAEICIHGLKSGFGSFATYHEKLDARLCAAFMSVQAVKGVEVGLGFGAAVRRGSEVHDEIFFEDGTYRRKTNRAGGIEGGVSNGEDIVLRAAMKPIPTLARGLSTVDIETHLPAKAQAERSDVCAILAFETILEAVACYEVCRAVLERLGGDTLFQVIARYGELQ